MDHPNEPSVVRSDVDVMDVSPNAHPDTTVVSDENKENDDADLEPAPPLTSVSTKAPATQNDAQPSQTNTPAEDDPRETQFAYVLRKYDSILENRIYSPWHLFGGFKWRLLIFPKGNHTSNHDLSVYLESGGPITRDDQPAPQPHPVTSPNGKGVAFPTPPPASWSRPAKFSLHLVHPTSPIAKSALLSQSSTSDAATADLTIPEAAINAAVNINSGQKTEVVKETHHVFRHNASDWGFLEFAPFASLQPGHYADSDMNVVIMVKIKLQDASPDPVFASAPIWDSRKETGLVGFKNQGATCYMNSLLQTLYMLSAFRKAVYGMPLPETGNDNSGSELSYALQKVFYELQTSPTVVKTKKLTESFGWDTTDAFTQHDVQELKLILCDELAEKMKKNAPDQPNTLSTLFQGKILNYIECVHVAYKSTREEEFSDLSLNVKGCQNICESFEKYTEVEMMDGDNKYRADGFEELQDARKGVKFLQLPPVLQLHLKRFEYDTTRDAMVKINDRYEFETEIDLSRFVENSDGTDVYVLHSVLVHIGDVNGGHYHAFIRPQIDVSDEEPKKQSQWYKFDDETVSRATEEEAVLQNYGVGGEKDIAKRGGLEDDTGNGGINGGQTPPPSMFQTRNRNYPSRRFSNAYMLQYLRKSEVPCLLKAQAESDVPKELAERINKEREEEEQRKRDSTEQHLYVNIAVATAEDMVHYHGSDLVNWDKVRPLKVKRATQLRELKQLLQNEKLVKDARRMRLWRCNGRRNHTYRPDSLVANGVDTSPIDVMGRDPIVSGTYNPLYSGRHGYYGYEDLFRMFAEDLTSRYCLEGGKAYSDLNLSLSEHMHAKSMETDTVDGIEVKKKNDMEESRPLPDPSNWSFSLEQGVETLLFAKYYSPTPCPRLQWLGHFVADRNILVKDLNQFLRKAVERRHREDPSITLLAEDSPISVYEEIAATTINALDDSKSLEHHKIPCDSVSNGDILVFQQTPIGEVKADIRVDGDDALVDGLDSEAWDGFQEISRGDGTDLPMGGRPIPKVTAYFDYLAYRIKIEFKDRLTVGTPDEGKSIIFEMSRKDSYRTARRVLSGVLNEVDVDYLRFFAHDFNREAPAQEAFRLADEDPLERILPPQNLVTGGQAEYKTIWYERTEYHIKEFEQKDEVRVVWRADGGTRATPYITKNGDANCGIGRVSSENGGMNEVDKDSAGRIEMSLDVEEEKTEVSGEEQELMAEMKSVTSTWNGNGELAKWFSVLVPLASNYADVMDQVRIKLGVRSDVAIRMFEIKNSRIVRFVDPRESLPSLLHGSHDYGAELRAEPVPAEETEDELGSEYELMSVVHLAKDKTGRMWRGPTIFGEPFVIKVRQKGETVTAIRKRIQTKLGVPSEVFDNWPLAEISQIKVVYLESETVYKPRSQVTMEFCSLALEHKSPASPKRVSTMVSRYADKPLRIRS